jgi:hypothetical protein
MKHISEIIAAKKEQLGLEHSQQQLGLFSAAREKGSREWSLFDPVAHDRISAYPVTTPRKREEPRYPNVLHINRYPRHLVVRFAR